MVVERKMLWPQPPLAAEGQEEESSSPSDSDIQGAMNSAGVLLSDTICAPPFAGLIKDLDIKLAGQELQGTSSSSARIARRPHQLQSLRNNPLLTCILTLRRHVHPRRLH